MSAVIVERMEARRGRSDGRHAGLIEMNTDGSRPPFFFLHAALQGDGFYCYNLGRQLGPDQPVYALPPLGLNGEPIPPTIQQMAERQLSLIRAIQPHGPYYLGGFCISGVVALEAARLIQEAGEEVRIVVIVETRTHPPHIFNRLANRAAAMAQVLGRLTIDQRHDLLRRMRPAAYKAWELYQAGFFKAVRRIAQTAGSAIRSWFAGPGRHSSPRPPAAVVDSGRGPVARANNLAIHAYLPTSFGFPVACLWAAEEPMDQDTWRALVADLRLETVAGNHNTCITTQVATLAGAIRATLHRAQADVQPCVAPAPVAVTVPVTSEVSRRARVANAG
jgi:thioesterase domain-containing protein